MIRHLHMSIHTCSHLLPYEYPQRQTRLCPNLIVLSEFPMTCLSFAQALRFQLSLLLNHRAGQWIMAGRIEPNTPACFARGKLPAGAEMTWYPLQGFSSHGRPEDAHQVNYAYSSAEAEKKNWRRKREAPNPTLNPLSGETLDDPPQSPGS